VDKKGRFLGSRAVAGTQKFAISRVEKLDLDAVAASYGAREQSGAGVGVLSPRDSVKVDNAGGATLMIDYGRPSKRGRAVYGGIVPYGEVWRTGANAATQFRTDKALDFGGTVVPAGFYTLWTIPQADGWKLIVNSETGQWGTAHHQRRADGGRRRAPHGLGHDPRLGGVQGRALAERFGARPSRRGRRRR